MIAFYPRDIEMWRSQFDFNPPITCIQHEKTDHKGFINREEFIEFLKENGVRLDDPENPLKIEIVSPDQPAQCKGLAAQGTLFSVVQWSLLGWIRDNYR